MERVGRLARGARCLRRRGWKLLLRPSPELDDPDAGALVRSGRPEWPVPGPARQLFELSLEADDFEEALAVELFDELALVVDLDAGLLAAVLLAAGALAVEAFAVEALVVEVFAAVLARCLGGRGLGRGCLGSGGRAARHRRTGGRLALARGAGQCGACLAGGRLLALGLRRLAGRDAGLGCLGSRGLAGLAGRCGS